MTLQPSKAALAFLLVLQLALIVTALPQPQSGDGPGLQSGVDPQAETPPLIPYQTQIYIVSGTLGGILLLVILLVIALAISVSRLSKQLKKQKTRNIYMPTDDQNANSPPIKRAEEQPIAYDNSGFNGHEMQERRNDTRRTIEERGYTVYEGNRATENRYTAGNRDSRNTLMRYEDGVVPITSDRPNNRNNYRY